MEIRRTINYLGEELNIPASKQPNSFFDVNLYGTTNPNPDYELYHNPHAFHVFEYVISGEGFIDYDDKHIRVQAGDFYYLKYGFVGHYYASKDNPYKKIWVNATGTMIDSLAAAFNITEPVTISALGTPFENALLQLHAHLNACEGVPDSEVLRRCSVSVFELMSLAAGSRLIDENVYHIRFCDKVKQYIKNNIYSDLSLEEISSYFHMNPSHLIRCFKKETGITPMRYYNVCRIDAARSLIAFNNPPVKLVAARLKYSDQAYFSGCFKQETGVSPSEYTKEMHLEYMNQKNNKKC